MLCVLVVCCSTIHRYIRFAFVYLRVQVGHTWDSSIVGQHSGFRRLLCQSLNVRVRTVRVLGVGSSPGGPLPRGGCWNWSAGPHHPKIPCAELPRLPCMYGGVLGLALSGPFRSCELPLRDVSQGVPDLKGWDWFSKSASPSMPVGHLLFFPHASHEVHPHSGQGEVMHLETDFKQW